MLTTVHRPSRDPPRLQLVDRRLAVAHRAVRQPGRGGGRGPRQGAGRDAAQDQRRDRGPRLVDWQPARPDLPRSRARHRSSTLGDTSCVEAGEIIPGDGDVVEGVASRRRVGDHRRVGARHPRVRRRPVGGDRRHEGAVGPDRRADHLEAGRDLHRPDDRAGRGRLAAEDAERDRAEHPAGVADDHLHAGRRHAAADGDLLRRAADAGRAGRAAGLPDPDDDRRAALGHRHRRHGPARAAQRAGDVRPRGRGRGRREHAAAGQDRHDHARQPAGRRVPAGATA